MLIEEKLIVAIAKAIKELYGSECNENAIQLQKTKKEFEGDITLVVFPLLHFSKKTPEQTAEEMGNYLATASPEIMAYNVVKGFLNLIIADSYWVSFLNETYVQKDYGIKKPVAGAPSIMVEYSSPNTNKPLHLGHIRPIFSKPMAILSLRLTW